MKKRALVTGISGQDGVYLSKLLVDQGYEVFGTHRPDKPPSLERLAALGVAELVNFSPLSFLDSAGMVSALETVRPDEVYNLAGFSSVGQSFKQPVEAGKANALGVGRLLEAVRDVVPNCRFYQASSSEMFGVVDESPQDERTPFRPRSPYAISKLYGHWMTVSYRESYGLHACAGILFNHESPLRGPEFVTRKITRTLANIRHGAGTVLELGNLSARRDWGFAGDYVRGMWLMLQQEQPEEFVLATGQSHSVREFADKAANAAGFRLEWDGEGPRERAIDRSSGRLIIRVNPEFYRPAEVHALVGNPSKARSKLAWSPEVSFDELVRMMVSADMDRAAE